MDEKDAVKNATVVPRVFDQDIVPVSFVELFRCVFSTCYVIVSPLVYVDMPPFTRSCLISLASLQLRLQVQPKCAFHLSLDEELFS